ncbi:MAG: acVLRF1 family peptidyl-tRNA hydrolase [Micromonosporaceae bacterium]
MPADRRATRPAAGGGRWVEVAPERLPRWLAGFAQRHGEPTASMLGEAVCLSAPDGTVAELFPPPGAPAPASPADLVVQAQRPRRLGLLLARQGAVAVGIAEGARLTESKVETSYVQGRTAAGGWSQQRFARRRVNQGRAAATSAADAVARLLLPQAEHLAALVTGGDRRAVAAVLADRRLAGLAGLRTERFLTVGEPRRAVLEQAVAAARTVRIRLEEPGP